jgi:carbon-monoxide dehydrogenase large subunit
MGMEGIGARVARKEDKRFITGKGRYTDDMVVPGMKHAHFVRSPHAHAKIKSIDTSAAEKMPGVIGGLNGAQLAEDGIGNIICGWMIHSKDGSPMNMGAWRPLAQDTKVRYVGDAVAIVVADTRPRHATPPRRSSSTTKPAGGHRVPSRRSRTARRSSSGSARQPHLRLGDRRQPRAADAAIASARMSPNEGRQQPPGAQPDGAARRARVYDEAEDHYTLWTTSQNPHVARLVLSAFYNVAPENKLRVIAPDVGGGFGSKIYIYPEEIVCLWASKRTGVPVKWNSDRTEAFLTDAHGRDHVTTVEMAFDADNKITGFKVDTIANLGAYMSLFSSSVPTYLYATLLSGQYNDPGDPRQCAHGLHQHRAGGRLSRRGPARSDLSARAGA